MRLPWQQTTVTVRRTSIITTAQLRLNPRPRYLLVRIRPSAPWIAAWRDICEMAQRFPRILFFPHWQ